MLEHANPNTRRDVEHDFSRLVAYGQEALDVVVFKDINQMGAPLALSAQARGEIYALVTRDLLSQLNPYQNHAPS